MPRNEKNESDNVVEEKDVPKRAKKLARCVLWSTRQFFGTFLTHTINKKRANVPIGTSIIMALSRSKSNNNELLLLLVLEE